jgi:rare lipoprotein A
VRPQLRLRPTLARVAVSGALMIGTGLAGVAPLAAPAARAQAQPAMKIADPSIRFGQAAVVRGTVGAENARRTVALEFGPRRGGWRVVKTAIAAANGSFAFRVKLRHSGELRVAVGDETTARAALPVATAAARSPAQPVRVAAHIPVPRRQLDVLAGRAAVVRGTLQPWHRGRLVRLEVLQGRRWRAVDHDRTDARGRYALAHVPRSTGSRYARVTFPGDEANSRTVRRVGRLSAYRRSLASRYDLYGGALACGGSLGYHALVVAHKTLPCGTRVRIRYRGRSVTATVRDRGPFVGGREFDLAGAVARRLGFNGVGTIWVTR